MEVQVLLPELALYVSFDDGDFINAGSIGVTVMVAEKRFSMRLSNGREASFETAAEMLAWMERQRSPQPARPSRRRRGNAAKKRTPAVVDRGQPPLARFRQS